MICMENIKVEINNQWKVTSKDNLINNFVNSLQKITEKLSKKLNDGANYKGDLLYNKDDELARQQEKYLKKLLKAIVQEGSALQSDSQADEYVQFDFVRNSLVNIQTFMQRIPVTVETNGIISFIKYCFGYGETRGYIYDLVDYIINKLKQQKPVQFQSINSNQNLTSLKLSNVKLEKESIINLGKLTQLNSLALISILSIKPCIENLSSYTNNKEVPNTIKEECFLILCVQFGKLTLLRNLNLKNNLIGLYKQDTINKFAKALAKLSRLNELDLTDNFIDNESLNSLNQLGLAKLDSLSEINFSLNFLTSSESSLYDAKKILENIKGNSKAPTLKIIISGNYINGYRLATKDVNLNLGEDPFFEQDPFFRVNESWLKSEPITMESLINPSYLIKEKKWLVTISNLVGHAGVLVDRMDKYGQLSLMLYDLNSDGDVEARQLPSVTDFIKQRHYAYSFWQFKLCGNSKVKKIEQEIWQDAKKLREPIKFSLCCTSVSKRYKNCLTYAKSCVARMENFPEDTYSATIPVPA